MASRTWESVGAQWPYALLGAAGWALGRGRWAEAAGALVLLLVGFFAVAVFKLAGGQGR